ncbi:MAG TPA: isochorismatase family protein [Galbitalea sp.]|jgi:nicotinamidase-related amidase
MTLTTLDPKTALIVVDLQRGVVALPAAAHSMETVIRNSAALADAFRAHGLPVVLVNVSGAPAGRTERASAGGVRPEGWDILIDELNQQATDKLVTKRTRGAFTGTDLEQYLRANDVTQVVITGVATGSGVESTARHAHELGFNVTISTDAMTDMNAEVHENSVTRIFPGIGETGTTDEILSLLAATRS